MEVTVALIGRGNFTAFYAPAKLLGGLVIGRIVRRGEGYVKGLINGGNGTKGFSAQGASFTRDGFTLQLQASTST